MFRRRLRTQEVREVPLKKERSKAKGKAQSAYVSLDELSRSKSHSPFSPATDTSPTTTLPFLKSRIRARPTLVSEDSKYTLKSIDSCRTLISDREATKSRESNQRQPLRQPPTRSNVEILAEIEDIVGRYEFEFEGFENLIVRTNQDEDDGISCFTSVGDLSFDDSAACDDYAPLRMSGTTSVDERDRFDGKIYASVVADDGFVHKQGVKELSLSAVVCGYDSGQPLRRNSVSNAQA